MIKRACQRVRQLVAVRQKVTFCPILSDTIPKIGARKALIKNTLLVIIAALF